MKQEVLDRIIAILEKADEFHVPVKKLRKMLHQEGYVVPAYEGLLKELKADKRFDIWKSSEERDWDEEEMEKLGFYSGPRVALSSRKPTAEDMQRILAKHAQNMIDNLVKAYQVRPTDMPSEGEDGLIEVMRKAKDFRQKIDQVFEKKTKPRKRST